MHLNHFSFFTLPFYSPSLKSRSPKMAKSKRLIHHCMSLFSKTCPKRTSRTMKFSKPRLNFIFSKASCLKRTPKMPQKLKPCLNPPTSKSLKSSCIFLLPSRTAPQSQEPPKEFKCPISNTIMYDPIIFPDGRTFERACIEACIEINCIPSIILKPHDDLKLEILAWCDNVGHPYPNPISEEVAHVHVKKCPNLQELLRSVFSDSGCFLESQSSFSFDYRDLSRIEDCSAGSVVDEEECLLKKLSDAEISTRQEALAILNDVARQSRDRKISLCSHKILKNIVPKLHSRHPPIQIIRATAFLVTLSSEPANRVRLAQSGAVIRLISVLKNRKVSARDLAARVLSNLSLEITIRELIGSTPGAFSALLDHFSEVTGNYRGRKYSGMTLYRLCLNCPDNIITLSETEDAVQKLLIVAINRSSYESIRLGSYAIVVLDKIAWINSVSEKLINSGAVGYFVWLLSRDVELGEEEFYYLSVMFMMCYHYRGLFRKVAMVAGAEGVLVKNKEVWGEVGMEMARRMLRVIREDNVVV